MLNLISPPSFIPDSCLLYSVLAPAPCLPLLALLVCTLPSSCTDLSVPVMRLLSLVSGPPHQLFPLCRMEPSSFFTWCYFPLLFSSPPRCSPFRSQLKYHFLSEVFLYPSPAPTPQDTSCLLCASLVVAVVCLFHCLLQEMEVTSVTIGLTIGSF